MFRYFRFATLAIPLGDQSTVTKCLVNERHEIRHRLRAFGNSSIGSSCVCSKLLDFVRAVRAVRDFRGQLHFLGLFEHDRLVAVREHAVVEVPADGAGEDSWRGPEANAKS